MTNPMTKIDTAIRLAAIAHENQKDKAGEPYILHPLRIMMNVESYTDKTVAILHDVIEDSFMDEEYLSQNGITSYIIDKISLLTRKDKQPWNKYIREISLDDTATRIKIEDLKDNLNILRLPKITSVDLDRIRMYHSALVLLGGL